MKDPLGAKIEVVGKTIQVLSVVAGIVVFLLFFALAPLHALILSGFVIVFAGLFFNLQEKIRQTAIYLGIVLIALGFTGIYLPAVARGLSLLSESLKELMMFPAGV
jgi:hypothetical protein